MITIGHCPEADIRIDNLRFTATGQDMRFTYQEIPRLSACRCVENFKLKMF
jgi:hypothetical protein